MFCNHCGSELDESTKFCGKCGAPVMDTGAGVAPMQPVSQAGIYNPNQVTAGGGYKAGAIILAIISTVFAAIATFAPLLGGTSIWDMGVSFFNTMTNRYEREILYYAMGKGIWFYVFIAVFVIVVLSAVSAIICGIVAFFRAAVETSISAETYGKIMNSFGNIFLAYLIIVLSVVFVASKFRYIDFIPYLSNTATAINVAIVGVVSLAGDIVSGIFHSKIKNLNRVSGIN